MKAAASSPDASVLFDSTIREPTDLLAGVVRRAFEGGVTDRYESVFAEGNRFVVAKVAERYGVPTDQVIGTTGATSAIALVLKALVGRGDNVLIESPCFDLLPQLARDAGASVTELPRRAPDYAVDPAEVARLIRPDTRLIVLTQLHNPTGAVLDDATLRELAEVSRTSGVPILVDEAYADFVGDGVSAVRLGPEFISVGSLTKVQGLFALKCGWLVAAPEIIARVHAANPQGDLGVSKLAHAVAALVLEDRAPFDAHWREVLARARPVVQTHVEAMIAEGLLEGDLPGDGLHVLPAAAGGVRHPGADALALERARGAGGGGRILRPAGPRADRLRGRAAGGPEPGHGPAARGSEKLSGAVMSGQSRIATQLRVGTAIPAALASIAH